MNNGETQTHGVSIMLLVKRRMETVHTSLRTPEYNAILQQVKNYLHKYCKHEIECDLIDIDPDKSEMIHYCTICESTL